MTRTRTRSRIGAILASPPGLRAVVRCSARQRLWLAAIVVVAGGLRLGWVLYATRPAVGLFDPTWYPFYASRISGGDGYTVLGGAPTAYYPIGYPAALALVFWVFQLTSPDSQVMAAAFLNLAFAVATVFVVFELARRLFDPTVGLVAAAVYAVFPNLVVHTGVALTETVFNFFVLAAVLVLLAHDWRPGGREWPRLVTAGVLLSATILIRPISVLLLPVLLVLWLRSGGGLGLALRRAAVVGATMAVVIAPWTIRNTAVMDSPILISSNLGDNFCIGHHPNATGAFTLPEECIGAFDDLDRPELEVKRNNAGTRRGLEYLVGHPVNEVRLVFWRAFYTLHHDHDGLLAAESYGEDLFVSRRWREVLETVSDAFFFAVATLALLSLPSFRARSRSRSWPSDLRRPVFVLAGTSLVISPLLFFGDARFHVPISPFLAVGAAVALTTWWRAQRDGGDGQEGTAVVHAGSGEVPVRDLSVPVGGP